MITLEQTVDRYCESCGKEIPEDRLLKHKTTCCHRCANSLAAKRQWANKEKRQKLLFGIKKSAITEESKLKRSKISKQMWQDSEFRNKMHALYSTEASKSRRSKASKRNWQNAEIRERTTLSIRQAYSSQELRDKISLLMKTFFASKESRRLRSLASTSFWSNLDNRKKQSKKLKEVYKNQELRDKISKKVKARLAIPEIKEKHKRGIKLAYKTKGTEILKHIIETKRKNGTFNTSKVELYILNLLQQKFSLVMHQYKCEAYPYNCDFYIPELNLFIEYNGTWTHGFEPFNENNIEHLTRLFNWIQKAKTSKFYATAIYVWTYLDAKKRQVAKENNLNYLSFYNLNQFMLWYNSLVFNKETY